MHDHHLDLLPTEQRNPRTLDLDLLDTETLLLRLNDEDARVAAAVRLAIPAIGRAVDLAADRWRRGGRVVLFGAGTSGRLAAVDAAELGPTFGVPPDRYLARMAGGSSALGMPVEGAEDDTAAGWRSVVDLEPRDVAVGIAASGRTPWVLGALQAARERGAATIGLACVPAPHLTRHSDVTISVDTGPEALMGSTRLKAGTAQKLVLNAFSTALMVRDGKTYSNLMVDLQVTNAKLRRRAVRLIEEATGAQTAAADEALLTSGGSLKGAIALLRLGLPVDEIRERLVRHNGRLRQALGEIETARERRDDSGACTS